MNTRRRNKQRLRHTRKQFGGKKGNINYTLEEKDTTTLIAFDNLKTLIPDKEYVLKISLENETEEKVPFCILQFTFNKVGDLDLLHCLPDVKLERYKLKSYLIIRKFLEIIKEAYGIRTVYLMPLSNPTKGFMKLYNFYKTMGFVCIGEYKDLDAFIGMDTNNARLEHLYETKIKSDRMLKTLTDKNTLNESNIRTLVTKSCIYMAGSVDHVLETIQDQISKWDAATNNLSSRDVFRLQPI
jgi:hypothetical protein